MAAAGVFTEVALPQLMVHVLHLDVVDSGGGRRFALELLKQPGQRGRHLAELGLE